MLRGVGVCTPIQLHDVFISMHNFSFCDTYINVAVFPKINVQVILIPHLKDLCAFGILYLEKSAFGLF